jgi:hypothetical protein
MRLGFFGFEGHRGDPQQLILPGSASAAYPASTRTQVFGCTYGLDYLWNPPRIRGYLLAGTGIAYFGTARYGSIDLTAAGEGSTRLRFAAGNFNPYLALGGGYRFTRNLAVEARWQGGVLNDTTRPVDFSRLFLGAGQAPVNGFTVSEVSLGLVIRF